VLETIHRTVQISVAIFTVLAVLYPPLGIAAATLALVGLATGMRVKRMETERFKKKLDEELTCLASWVFWNRS